MLKSKKISDTSIRVLETLKILSKNNVSVQDIISYFEKFDPNNRIYTSEVILKYINTLKVFGFRFVKEKDKYVLLNTPNQFDFDENDLKSLYLIDKFANVFPEEKVKKEINGFINNLRKKFSDNTTLLAKNVDKPNPVSLGLSYAKYIEQIKKYEKFCQDKQRLKITYKNYKEAIITIMVEPNEIRYKNAEVYLNAYSALSAQVLDINFDSIIAIEQLPVKSNSIMMPSSVTFKLKGRLAKGYKLHDGEKVLQIESNGDIIILNQQEDRQLFLRRLMRYGENCEVISPQNIREEMYELIKSTLNNYN